jgi:hypothetical protein
VRILVVAPVVLAVCVASASAATTLAFKRADGTALRFPADARAWCARDGLHVVTPGTTRESRWQLSIPRKNVRSGRMLPFSTARPNGVEIFVFDAKTHNEASDGAEGSHGRVQVWRAACLRGARLLIGVSGVVASELSDGKPVRVSGTFEGRVGTPPR